MSPTEAGREAQKREVFRRMVREATSTQTCQDDFKFPELSTTIISSIETRMTSSSVS